MDYNLYLKKQTEPIKENKSFDSKIIPLHKNKSFDNTTINNSIPNFKIQALIKKIHTSKTCANNQPKHKDIHNQKVKYFIKKLEDLGDYSFSENKESEAI